MKHIRELRIGPPKSGKTVAVVGTYPKPMLVFLFDKGGLDVIPSTPTTDRAAIKLDVLFSDLVFIKPDELITYCKKPTADLPKVTVIDFTSHRKLQMTEKFEPIADSQAYMQYYQSINYLVTIGCPWKTFVMDSVTTLCDTLMSLVAEKNTSWLSDARKWSPAIGSKVLQNVAVMANLPLNTVFIAHSHMEKNELTGDISIIPLGPNRLSEQIGSLVSQYLYATNESGMLQVYTKPKGNVKAIGVRWPNNLPQVCGADFTSIYGKELLV
jgi:hypothetical protein